MIMITILGMIIIWWHDCSINQPCSNIAIILYTLNYWNHRLKYMHIIIIIIIIIYTYIHTYDSIIIIYKYILWVSGYKATLNSRSGFIFTTHSLACSSVHVEVIEKGVFIVCIYIMNASYVCIWIVISCHIICTPATLFQPLCFSLNDAAEVRGK